MSRTTLTISSKNYSSWSLRGWLMAKIAENRIRRGGRRAGRRGRARRDPAPFALDPRAVPHVQRHPGLGHAGDRRVSERDRAESGASAQRSGNARALPVDLRRNALGFRLASSGAADEHQGRNSAFQDLVEGARATSIGSRRSGANASRPMAARSCSARSAMADAMYAPGREPVPNLWRQAGRRLEAYADRIWDLPAMKNGAKARSPKKEEIEELEVEF